VFESKPSVRFAHLIRVYVCKPFASHTILIFAGDVPAWNAEFPVTRSIKALKEEYKSEEKGLAKGGTPDFGPRI
jgi:hypothetical protein